MKTESAVLNNLKGIGLALTATMLFSSAYPVFANETKNLVASTSFFWFSCFACLASWIFFRPEQKWSESIKQGGKIWLATDVCFYCLQFFCTLIALKQQQTGTALTVIVIMALRAPATTIAGYFITKDSCQRWLVYWFGTILVVLGIFLYRLDVLQESGFGSLDLVTKLSLCGTLLSSLDTATRKRYRNTYKIDPANAVRSVFSAAVVLSFCWMMFDVSTNQVSPWPISREWLALAYLGILPTTLASIWLNKAEDRLSIPITQSILSSMPVFTLALGLIPLSCFVQNRQLGLTHGAGLLLAIIGAAIVTAFAGVKERFPKSE